MRKKICLLLAMLLVLTTFGACSAAQNGEEPSDEKVDAGIGDPEDDGLITYADENGSVTTAFRMFPTYWLKDEDFEKTLAGLSKYKDIVDQVVLFCDNRHTVYQDDAELEQYTSALKERVKALKEAGFRSVGFNMLQTLGHGDYGTGWLKSATYPVIVGHDGTQGVNQPCYRDQQFLDYIQKKYKAYAECGPEFIWIDDDFRASDQTIPYGCFCPNCIAAFNAKYGYSYSRESLVELLDRNNDNSHVVRERWSDYVLEAWCKVVKLCADATHEVNPDIAIGQMTVHLGACSYAGSDYGTLIEASGATMARPGGGVYVETTPNDIMAKIYGIALQVSEYSETPQIQYEFESFPLNYNNSSRFANLQSTAGLMVGCNGIAYASLPPDMGAEYIMDGIRRMDTFWNEINDIGFKWKLYGSTGGYSNDYHIYCEAGHYFSWSEPLGIENSVLGKFSTGYLSYTPYQENAQISFFSKDQILAYDEAELKEIFSKGAWLDGKAAYHLWKNGYGYLIGCDRCAYQLTSVEERLTDDELNGAAAGQIRYEYGSEVFTFSTMSGARKLGVAESPNELTLGVSSYVYENELGGRVAVMGYIPYNFKGTWMDLEQSDHLYDWLAKDQTYAKVENQHRVALLFKQPDDHKDFMCMAINTSLDDTGEAAEVRLKGSYKQKIYCYNDEGVKSEVEANDIRVENGFTYIKLPQLRGWGFCVLFTDPRK